MWMENHQLMLHHLCLLRHDSFVPTIKTRMKEMKEKGNKTKKTRTILFAFLGKQRLHIITPQTYTLKAAAE